MLTTEIDPRRVASIIGAIQRAAGGRRKRVRQDQWADRFVTRVESIPEVAQVARLEGFLDLIDLVDGSTIEMAVVDGRARGWAHWPAR